VEALGTRSRGHCAGRTRRLQDRGDLKLCEGAQVRRTNTPPCLIARAAAAAASVVDYPDALRTPLRQPTHQQYRRRNDEAPESQNRAPKQKVIRQVLEVNRADTSVLA
jgi:hypothetical protein